jgi:hypothetical protein
MNPQDEIDPEQRSCSEGLPRAYSQIPACRFDECRYSKGKHYEDGLKAGEEYFFVLLMPADPDSFVALSSVTYQSYRNRPRRSAPGCRPPDLLSWPRSGSSGFSSADMSDLVSSGTGSNRRASPSPEPDVNEKRPPTERARGANPPTVVTASAPATATIPERASGVIPPTVVPVPARATDAVPANSFSKLDPLSEMFSHGYLHRAL